MSKEKTKTELYDHKATAFQKLDQYLNMLIESDDKKKKEKPISFVIGYVTGQISSLLKISFHQCVYVGISVAK